MKRRLVLPALLAWGYLLLATAVSAREPDWPAWQRFKHDCIEDNGRVIDRSDRRRITTSEGQAYGLLLALVANDQAVFGRLLHWTEQHLAQGDLSRHLPAWLWGLDGDGQQRVLDSNAAADADLWMAYSLIEAGRLWGIRQYTHRGQQLLVLILAREVRILPGLGPMLLPGPQGFIHPDQRYRLNPSYLPLQLLTRLARFQPAGPWQTIADNTLRLLQETTPHGWVADWLIWSSQGWQPDPERGWLGSYDAIRVYLWAGMLHPASPAFPRLMALFSPAVDMVIRDGWPPERVDTRSGTRINQGPPGFSAAMLPLLVASRQPQAVARQLARLETWQPARENYYDQVLGLFGLGWLEHRYCFGPEGRLQPAWEAPCA